MQATMISSSVFAYMQGNMLQGLHSQLLLSNQHAPSWAHDQQQAASGVADDTLVEGCRSRAAAPQDIAYMHRAMQEVLDETLWPLEALLEQAVGECFCFKHYFHAHLCICACLLACCPGRCTCFQPPAQRVNQAAAEASCLWKLDIFLVHFRQVEASFGQKGMRVNSCCH